MPSAHSPRCLLLARLTTATRHAAPCPLPLHVPCSASEPSCRAPSWPPPCLQTLPVYVQPPGHAEIQGILRKYDIDGSGHLSFEVCCCLVVGGCWGAGGVGGWVGASVTKAERL
jgi:hypothetical protein